jgi:hypothetical protein
MEGSKPDGKKIVLKKLTRKEPSLEDELAALIPQQQTSETEDAQEENRFFYEGEVFDQFHRYLGVSGGVDRLRDIAQEPLTPAAPAPRHSAAIREALALDRQALAEALAHQIYTLAQVERETDIEVYLSAFNVAVARKTCQEARDILVRANEFFGQHYYAAIRERGERPEIYNQILKRVGHAHAERLSKIVCGLDIEATTQKLWALYHGAIPDKQERILDILLDCTETQVRAIREEFVQMPFKDLARQLHSVLNPKAVEAPLGSRRTIGKSELVEHKRSGAFRARDQLRTLRYLLLGRGRDELSIVKRFYIELGDQSLPDADLSLEAAIKRTFPPAEVDRLASLLVGWSPHQEAEEFNKLLFSKTVHGKVDDPLSDPRDAVDREYTQGLGPFLQRFKKYRLRQASDSISHYVFASYELLRERVAALSPTRFVETNAALRQYYGYDLDPTLFPSLGLFDARMCAITMHERLSASFDLYEAVQPMEFLGPHQCLAVQKAFQCVFGEDLREAVARRLKTIGTVISKSEFNDVISRVVDGHGRWPLDIDILARYRGGEPEPSVWDHDFVCSDEDQSRAMHLGELVDRDAEQGDLELTLREFLVGLTVDELHRVERSFYDLTDPHLPLVSALREVMSSASFEACSSLFVGIETTYVVQRLYDDPLSIILLRDLPAWIIKMVRTRYQGTFFEDLAEHILKSVEQSADVDAALEALGVLQKPDIFEVRVALGSIKRDSSPEVEVIRGACAGHRLKVMGFERGYDVVFPRLRVHLKMAAAKMAITVATFSEVVLLLEGVDPEITHRIQECFDAVDVEQLQEILRANKVPQRMIEECYDLLFPERTLRHALKEMPVDLDHINETMLHLEGFCSKAVAEEIGGLLQELSGEELAVAVLAVLSPQTAQGPNNRIPQDINWMDEMNYQIGLSYRRLYGEPIVAACRKRGVGDAHLEQISCQIYGMEVFTSARELFGLIKSSKDGTPAPEGAEARITSYLESRGQKYRERLMNAYQAFWAHTPGYSGLLDDMTKFFKDSSSKRRLLALFLGNGSDRKTPPTTPPEMH